MIDDDDDRPRGYASPPCFMHEIDPAYMGFAEAADPQQRTDVLRWRKAERARLITARLALPEDIRRAHDERIATHLEAAIGDVAGLTIGGYWPFRGEPNLHALLERVVARGGRTALPVVVARGEPLVFRAWTPGETLVQGAMNIPVPAESAETALPDVVIAPMVGFDATCHWLGYGGGLLDRTLAAWLQRPRTFGVAYGQAEIATIYPQPQDIAMDAVVTESGVVTP